MMSMMHHIVKKCYSQEWTLLVRNKYISLQPTVTGFRISTGIIQGIRLSGIVGNHWGTSSRRCQQWDFLVLISCRWQPNRNCRIAIHGIVAPFLKCPRIFDSTRKAPKIIFFHYRNFWELRHISPCPPNTVNLSDSLSGNLHGHTHA